MRAAALAILLAPSLALAQPVAGRDGVTFEANIGAGFVHAGAPGSDAVDTDLALAGLDVGLGGWLAPDLALTARIAGVQVQSSHFDTGGDGTLVQAFFGPELQYWSDPHFFYGGGVGLSTFRLIGSKSCSGSDCGTNGLGFDLRAGYSFGGETEHAFDVSVELNTGLYSHTDGTTTVTGIAFLVGYQYL
jgi:hypothetical protein